MCVPHFFVVTMGNVPELESFPRGKAGRLTSLIVWKLVGCKPRGHLDCDGSSARTIVIEAVAGAAGDSSMRGVVYFIKRRIF